MTDTEKRPSLPELPEKLARMSDSLQAHIRAYASEAIRLSHTWPTLRDERAQGEGEVVTDEAVERGCIAAIGVTGFNVANWPHTYPDANQLRKVVRAILATRTEARPNE